MIHTYAKELTLCTNRDITIEDVLLLEVWGKEGNPDMGATTLFGNI